MSSASMEVHCPQPPLASFTRSCTTTSVTSPCAQVTPTAENGSVSGWDTVSAGTPGSSSPELATSPAGGSVAGAPVAGALGAAVGDVGAASACGSPSVVTTASPSGAATEPRPTSSIDGSTGRNTGPGLA